MNGKAKHGVSNSHKQSRIWLGQKGLEHKFRKILKNVIKLNLKIDIIGMLKNMLCFTL